MKPRPIYKKRLLKLADWLDAVGKEALGLNGGRSRPPVQSALLRRCGPRRHHPGTSRQSGLARVGQPYVQRRTP